MNNTSTVPEEGVMMTDWVLIFLGITTVMMNLPAAIVVLAEICKNKKPQNSVMLLSLSFTDLMSGISLIALADLYVRKRSIDFSTCVAQMTLLAVTYIAAAAHVFNISLERVCFICFKIQPFRTHRKIIWMLSIFISWIISGVLVACMQLFKGKVDNNVEECSLKRLFATGFPAYGTYLAVLQFGIVINIFVLIVYLLKHQISMRENNIETLNTKEIRSIISISLISAVTTLAGLPFTFILIYGAVYGYPATTVTRATFFLSELSAIANPIIYIFRIKKFKTSVKYLCCKDNSVAPS